MITEPVCSGEKSVRRMESEVGAPSTIFPGNSVETEEAARGVAVVVPEAALEPILLVATTEHECWTPLLSPVTTTGLVVPLAARLVAPAAQVTV